MEWECLPHGAILNIKDEQKLTPSLAPVPPHTLHCFLLLHPGPLCPKSEVVSGLEDGRKPSSLWLSAAPPQLAVSVIWSFQAQLGWESEVLAPSRGTAAKHLRRCSRLCKSRERPLPSQSAALKSSAEGLGVQHRDTAPSPTEVNSSSARACSKPFDLPERLPQLFAKYFLLIFGRDKGMHYCAATWASSGDIQIALSHPKQMPQNTDKSPPAACLGWQNTNYQHLWIRPLGTRVSLCFVLFAKPSSPRTQRGAQRFWDTVTLQPHIQIFMKAILGRFSWVASGSIRPLLRGQHPLAGSSSCLPCLSGSSHSPKPETWWPLQVPLCHPSIQLVTKPCWFDFLNQTQICPFLFPFLFNASWITAQLPAWSRSSSLSLFNPFSAKQLTWFLVQCSYYKTTEFVSAIQKQFWNEEHHKDLLLNIIHPLPQCQVSTHGSISS